VNNEYSFVHVFIIHYSPLHSTNELFIIQYSPFRVVGEYSSSPSLDHLVE